jgi:hypothetical protein
MVSAALWTWLVGCTASTEATEVGVRTVNVSLLGGRGIQQEVYAQGQTYFFSSGRSRSGPCTTWACRTWPCSALRGEVDRSGDDSVRFKTIDGNDVAVDVTVVWQVEPSRARRRCSRGWGAPTRRCPTSSCGRVARTVVVRDVLNKLTSEEYYQADRRYQMAEEARTPARRAARARGDPDLADPARRAPVQRHLRGHHPRQEGGRAGGRAAPVRDRGRRRGDEARPREGQGRGQQDDRAGARSAEQRKLEADAIFYERERQAMAILSEMKARAEALQARAPARCPAAAARRWSSSRSPGRSPAKQILFVPSGGTDLRVTDLNAILSQYADREAAGAHAVTGHRRPVRGA